MECSQNAISPFIYGQMVSVISSGEEPEKSPEFRFLSPVRLPFRHTGMVRFPNGVFPRLPQFNRIKPGCEIILMPLRGSAE
jgi:hypothetical protein